MRRLLLSIASLILVPVVLLAEYPVSDVSIGPAPGERKGATIASDGDRFLAVWVDHRDFGTAVYGARFDERGTLLDPIGIRIAAVAESGNNRVAVVWTGDNYAVFWSDWNSAIGNSPAIFEVRVDRDGNVLDAPRFVLDGELIANPVAANDKRIVVVSWSGYAVLNRTGEVISFHPAQNFGSRVLRTSTGFLILGQDGGGAEILKLDENGESAETTLSLRLYTYFGAGACSGDSCLVTTSDGTFTNASVMRLDSSGHRIDTLLALPLSGTIIPHADGYLVIGGSQYLRLDHAGLPVGAPVTYTTGAGRVSSAVSNGREVGLAWTEGATSSYDTSAYGAILGTSTPALLSRSAPAQVAPAIAFGGSNFLVAWTEGQSLLVGRIGLDGRRFDGTGIVLSTHVFGGYYARNTRVVFDGEQYAVAWWEEGAGFRYARVPLTGPITAPVRSVPEAISTVFDLVANGSISLLVWSRYDQQAASSLIMAAELDRDGSLRTVPRVIAIDSSGGRGGSIIANPSASWNGKQWLVAWEVQRDSGIIPEFAFYGPFAIAGVAVYPEALVPVTSPFLLSADASGNAGPRIASNGDQFFVAWTGRDENGQQLVIARRVDGNGQPLDAAAVELGRGRLSDVQWDGSRYELAVTRSLLATNPYQVDPSSYDAILMRVHPSVPALRAEMAVISATAGGDYAGELAVTGTASVIAAYSHLDLAAGGVQRVFISPPRPARARAARSR